MTTGEWCQSRWSCTSGKNLQCELSESEMELERFKRLVYTLHPKATSLRMHSMRKRRVTTKFTMVKRSNKNVGASWYYKIHPIHRRNTASNIPLCALHIYIYVYPFVLFKLVSVFDRSLHLFFSFELNSNLIATELERRETFFLCKINVTYITNMFAYYRCYSI